MKKRVLFVDDEPNVLQGLRRSLRAMRSEWDMRFVDSGPAALAQMEEQPFDVVISDMRMPVMDGAELLTKVRDRYPEAVRIILSGQTQREALLRSIGPSHQFLSKPCDAETLKLTLSRTYALRDILSSDRISFVSKMKSLPSLPEIYFELMEELDSEQPVLAHVATLIEKDVSMTAKILQLVNSAYFGVRRHISSASAAVNLLGIDNVRSVVLFANVFSADKIKRPLPNFSLEALWQHSAMVAKLGQEILKREVPASHEIDSAFTAGLLHDCGKLVLAQNMPDKYSEILSKCEEEGLPLHEIEKDVLGASHAEIGAYLIGLWGLPNAIVEAIAFHHNPADLPHQGLIPLAVIHAANFIEQERHLSEYEIGSGSIDTSYLAQLGFDGQVEEWKGIDI